MGNAACTGVTLWIHSHACETIQAFHPSLLQSSLLQVHLSTVQACSPKLLLRLCCPGAGCTSPAHPPPPRVPPTTDDGPPCPRPLSPPLPTCLPSSPHLQVRDWYVESFRELRSFPKVRDASDELQFTRLLQHIYRRHTNVVPVMAMGVAGACFCRCCCSCPISAPGAAPGFFAICHAHAVALPCPAPAGCWGCCVCRPCRHRCCCCCCSGTATLLSTLMPASCMVSAVCCPLLFGGLLRVPCGEQHCRLAGCRLAGRCRATERWPHG